MKLKTGGGGGGDFLQQPGGMIPAVLCDVVDEGEKETTWGPKQKLSLRFQSAQLITEEDFLAQGKEVRPDVVGEPFLYVSWYTASLNDKSRLTQDLKAWGVNLPGSGADFDLDSLIGRNALLNVQAIPPKAGSGKTTPFMAVQTINPLPANMEAISVSPSYTRVQDREQDTSFDHGANVQPAAEESFADGSPVPDEPPPGVV